MRTNHSLSTGSVNLILWAARQRGADADALIQAVGLDPDRLQHPDERVPIAQVQALWREAIAATGDPHLDLRLGELINPLSMGVLAYVLMHSPTLGRALEKLFQYQEIVCNAILTSGRRDGSWYELVLRLSSPEIIRADYALNSEVSVYLAAFRALTGRPFEASEIRFAYSHPPDTHEHERIFTPARLHFDAPETVLRFSADWLDVPILNANPGLFPLFEQHADDLLRGLRQPRLSDRVKTELVRRLRGEEPTLAGVADHLAMGVRTLQLHLREEGLSYQQLLDEVRRELAVRHLREPHLSTTDIAYLLGFAEPSVFFRSFKRWTGQTPGAFRAQAA